MSADSLQQRLTAAIRARLQNAELPDVDVDELAELAVAAALDGQQPPQPEFASLWDFVSQWLLPTYRRISDHPNFAWGPQWWRHPEVVVRLDALWRSWEHLRLEPGTGMSVWLKDHLDHHMAILLSQDGPMHRCKPSGHHDRPLEPIPSDTPPASWITGDIDLAPDGGGT